MLVYMFFFLNSDCLTVEYFEKLQWPIIYLNNFLLALITV